MYPSDNLEIEKTYQRILEIDPTNEDALRFLGEEDGEMTDFGLSTETVDLTAESPVVNVVAVAMNENVAENSFDQSGGSVTGAGAFAGAENFGGACPASVIAAASG